MMNNPRDALFVFGKRLKEQSNVLNLGKFYALDGSHGKDIFLDVSHPHVLSIFGKRGYGKSYTMGVIIEEIAQLPDHIRNELSIIIIDTLGIFWTMAYPNMADSVLLKKWNLTPKSIDIHLFSPKMNKGNENQSNDHIPLTLPPNCFSSEMWCQLFDIEPTSPFGIILIKTVNNIQKEKDEFTLGEIFQTITKNEKYGEDIKNIAENYYNYAVSLGIFTDDLDCIDQLLRPGTINILDISMLQGTHIKQMVTGVISEILFQRRVAARKNEEVHRIHNTQKDDMVPKIWLALDEAQIFIPKNSTHFCKTTLIEHWLRQGRQPGLSLIFATQQPSALDTEVFSHSDLIFCHRLTAQNDINALHTLRPSYMYDSIASIIEKMGHEKGVCNIIDDTLEQAHICKIRPRRTWHGGNEPIIKAV